MNIIITKKQYKQLIYSIIDFIVGGELYIMKDYEDNFLYFDIMDAYGEEVMTVYYGKASGKTQGCKNDLGLNTVFVNDLEKYFPYFKHKLFSKVMVDYVYDKLKIKCDCIDYLYDNSSERFIYNIKKKIIFDPEDRK